MRSNLIFIIRLIILFQFSIVHQGWGLSPYSYVPFPKSKKIYPSKLLDDKFKGALLGTSVGDALGMPLEDKTYEQILSEFGGPVTEMLKGEGRWDSLDHSVRFTLERGHVTDDTAMTIILAKYLLNSQGEFDSDTAIEALSLPAYGSRLGFSKSTLKLFEDIQVGGDWRELLEKKRRLRWNNGAAMRIAPVSLMFYENLELERILAQSVMITHDDPIAIIGGMIQGYVIAKVLTVRSGHLKPIVFINHLLEKVKKWENQWDEEWGKRKADNNIYPDKGVYSKGLQKIKNWIEEGHIVTPVEIIRNLEVNGARSDGKWPNYARADRTVLPALYSFLRSPNSFKESVLFAINLGGDTDTIGAMAGAISGAYLGHSKIPSGWKNSLVLEPLIQEALQLEGNDISSALSELAHQLFLAQVRLSSHFFVLRESSNEEETQRLKYSYMKLGRQEELDNYAELFVQKLKEELGEDLKNWMIITPGQKRLPNAIYQIADRVAKILKLDKSRLEIEVDYLSRKMHSALGSKDERKKMVDGKLSHAPKINFADKRVIFLDDSYISGSTMDAAVDYLLKEGALEVKPFVLFKMISEKDDSFEKFVNRTALRLDGLDSIIQLFNDRRSIYSRRLLYYAYDLKEENFKELLNKLVPIAKLKFYYFSLAFFGPMNEALYNKFDMLTDEVNRELSLELPKSSVIKKIADPGYFEGLARILEKYEYTFSGEDTDKIATEIAWFFRNSHKDKILPLKDYEASI